MKIKVLVSCSGIEFSYKQGDVLEVSAELGKDLVNAKYAEEVKLDSKPKPKEGAKDNAEA